MSAQLPAKFSDLEPYVEAWAHASIQDRWNKRLNSTMEEIQAFYDAIMPRMEALVEHLNQFSLDAMPEKEKQLFRLAASLMEISVAVELFRAPDEANVFPAERVTIERQAIL